MRFMLFMIPNISETDWTPDAEGVAAMALYNNEMSKAGVLVSLDGLHPSSKGAQVSGAGGKITVTNGPFGPGKDIIGGYWLIDVSSREEAVEWAKRCPAIKGPASMPNYDGPVPVIEVRQIFEPSEFPPELQQAGGIGNG